MPAPAKPHRRFRGLGRKFRHGATTGTLLLMPIFTLGRSREFHGRKQNSLSCRAQFSPKTSNEHPRVVRQKD